MSHKFLRRPAVKETIQCSNSYLYWLISQGKFPKPYKIGRNSVWLESEVQDWIQQRIAERDATHHS